MTITYSGNFLRLLFHWKGSVWKSVWKELMIWLVLYYGIKFGFRFVIVSDSFNTSIDKLVDIFNGYTIELPIEFMLSFYVSQIINRWWSQTQTLPWPDDILVLVNSALIGEDRETHLKRRAVARYLVLTQTLALRNLSTRVRKRFPTMEHIVTAGLMTKEELDLYLSINCDNLLWQLPLLWSQTIITDLVGNEPGKLSPVLATAIFNEINKFRSSLRNLFVVDWICIPLVYTQATTIGLYGYFGLCLIGRQFFNDDVDTYVPFLTILKFIFYVGWFKVGQDLMRPFGEDDDDIELNYLLDRHLQVAMSFADMGSTSEHIRLIPDPFFQNKGKMIPHTVLSSKTRDLPPVLHSKISTKKKDKYDIAEQTNTSKRKKLDTLYF